MCEQSNYSQPCHYRINKTRQGWRAYTRIPYQTNVLDRPKAMDLVQLVQDQGPSHDVIDRAYLKRLASMPQVHLESEKASLQDKLGSERKQQQELAAKHTADFLSAKDDMERVSQLVNELKASTNEAVEVSLAAPKLPERAYTTLRDVLENDMMVYAQIDTLQELLSLPELVKDCIITRNYGTALDLASMTERLQRRYPHSPLVSDLVDKVQRSVDSMRESFLKTLREASRLPSLTRAVAFLRRLNFAKLEVVFIDSRWQFLQAQWNQIPDQLRQTQPLAYLKRVAEIYREHVFATISGYHTIFHDAQPSSNDFDTPQTHTKGDGSLRISQFARKALTALLSLLKEHAPLITDTSERASLWLQLAFCANSLGRIGADFWPLLDSEILSEDEWKEATQHQRDMASRVSTYAPTSAVI